MLPSTLFDKLTSTHQVALNAAWNHVASLPPADRVGLRCPSGPYQGWSAFAVAAHRRALGRWSREPMKHLLEDMRPEHLDACSVHGVPDGLWVWLGAMKQTSGSQDISHWFLVNDIASRWGEDKPMQAMAVLGQVLPKFDAKTQALFQSVWTHTWSRCWEEHLRFEVKSQSLPKLREEWLQAHQQGLKPPGCPFNLLLGAIIAHPQWCQDNLDVMRLWLVHGRREVPYYIDGISLAKRYEMRRMVREWIGVHRTVHRPISEFLMQGFFGSNLVKKEAAMALYPGLMQAQARRDQLALEQVVPASSIMVPRTKYRI